MYARFRSRSSRGSSEPVHPPNSTLPVSSTPPPPPTATENELDDDLLPPPSLRERFQAEVGREAERAEGVVVQRERRRSEELERSGSGSALTSRGREAGVWADWDRVSSSFSFLPSQLSLTCENLAATEQKNRANAFPFIRLFMFGCLFFPLSLSPLAELNFVPSLKNRLSRRAYHSRSSFLLLSEEIPLPTSSRSRHVGPLFPSLNSIRCNHSHAFASRRVPWIRSRSSFASLAASELSTPRRSRRRRRRGIVRVPSS
ncbi:hypothetical protein BDY24DRAFT_162418 [Mrakia frigida]|uniref:uncharacterized protein n=1 Tax=Mrakia frigida TaxID=29902 RepID=UPI003FCBF62E